VAAPDRPDYDQALKRLLGQAHDGFLALVAPDLTWRRERSPELPSGLRQADFVWEVARPDGAVGLLHLELQTRVDPDLGERLAEYALRLWRRDHLPVRSVVVLLRETRQAPGMPFRLDWGDAEVLRFSFDVVRLWELPQALVLGRPEPAPLPLATLMAGATAETAAGVAERLVRAALPLGERRELTGLLAALAGLRLPRAAVLEALRREPMIREILQESSVAEEWREQGREQGRQEGQRELVRLALEDRFGALASDEQAALAAADTATLRALVAHLADDSRDQLRARLGLA